MLLKIVCSFLLLRSVAVLSMTSAVTFELNGGRFGDNLLSLAQALWVHYHYHVPLLYKPFPYCELLRIHHEYQQYTDALANKYKKCVHITTANPAIHDDDTLYITTFKRDPGVNWSDPHFLDLLRAAIAPASPTWPYMAVSEGSHLIALHVRRGGGFSYDKRFYTKIPQQFPELMYYVRALQLLLNHLDGPCTIYLFTDDKKPKSLAKKIKKTLSPANQARINIIYRHHKNRHDANVLIDFFDMMQCTYLIRPCSHFSLFAELLGNCVVSIYPAVALHKKGNWGSVSEVYISLFVGETPQRQRISLNEYEGRYVPILHTATMQNIMLDPLFRVTQRVLPERLPSCY